jgi:reactive intermediate/imine deaminase
MLEMIHTAEAPAAIGTYSQAIKAGNTVYISGQIGIDPSSGEITVSDIRDEIHQVFKNLSAIVKASGGELHHIVKLTIYLIDFNHFPILNEAMSQLFKSPYPARATVGVKSLPRGAQIEVDAILVL